MRATPTPMALPLLRDLPILAKVGVMGLVLVFGGGLAASLKHIHTHYQNRDSRPGMTRDDVTAAYAGLTRPAALLEVARGRHPRVAAPGGALTAVTLEASAAGVLEKWLTSKSPAENFDNMDFADPTPREVLAASCSACHSSRPPATGGGVGAGGVRVASFPLETWEQIKPYAFDQTFERTPDRVKVISTHTHALSLATMGVALLVLAMLSTWPRSVVGVLVGAMGVGLAADIGGWWVTNWPAAGGLGVTMIISGGAAFSGSAALLLVLTFLEVCKPRRG